MAKIQSKNTPTKGTPSGKKRGRPRKAEPKPAPLRKAYTDDVRGEAKDLYLRGVNLERIGRYLAVPVRTLTSWQTKNDWTDALDPEGTAAKDAAARLRGGRHRGAFGGLGKVRAEPAEKIGPL